MDVCLRKNCKEKAYEDGFCAKHYNEIIKKLIPKVNESKTTKLTAGDSVSSNEDVSKTLFFSFSILAHIDRFANRLISSFNNLIGLTKDDTAGIYRQMSKGFIKKHNTKKAIPVLKRLVELDQNDADARFELGSAYLSEGSYDLAIAELEQAIKLNPSNYDFHYRIGLAYERKELFDMAIAAYKRAIKHNPNGSETYYRLGVVYDSTEKFEDALVSFIKAIELDPNQVNYHQSLGFTHESLNQHDEAVQCYKKAISLQQASL